MTEPKNHGELLREPIQLGPYLLLEKVAGGGMAEVFKAKSFGAEGFQRIVAVKRIRDTIAEDASFIRMFINEAKIASQLQHANIAQIFDLGKVDDVYYIAMEYVSGRDLRQLSDRLGKLRKQLPVDAASFIAAKMCEGLDYAHERRDEVGQPLEIVHRDVSPSNILMSFDGDVKLIDFGVAKAAGSTAQTQVGVLKGKLSYMSPEQVRGLPVDRRSDTFAVGIVLYEILTGERLFLGNTDFETLERIRKVEIVPPSLYNPDIPQEIEAIILKALQRNPDQRYQTAAEMHQDLQRWLLQQETPYSGRHLAAMMQGLFGEELTAERQRNESIRQRFPTMALHSPAPPVSAALPPATPVPQTPSPAPLPPPAEESLSWDDDESETQVFGDDDEALIVEEELLEEEAADAWDEVLTQAADEPDTHAAPIPVTVPTTRRPARPSSTADEPAVTSPLAAAPLPASTPAVTEKTATAAPTERPPRPSAPAPAVERIHAPQAAAPVAQERTSAIPWVLAAGLLAVALGGVIWWMAGTPATPAAGELAIVLEGTGDAEARMLLDHAVIAEGAGTLRAEAVAAGVHRIRVEADGFEPLEREARIVAGQTTQLTWSLDPSTTTLMVRSSPEGALLRVNGEPRGSTPLELRDRPLGERIELALSLEGYEPLTAVHTVGDAWPESFELQPGLQEITVTVTPTTATLRIIGPDETTVAEGAGPDLTTRLAPQRLHRVVAEADGHEPFDEAFRPSSLEDGTLAVRLSRAPRPEPAAARASAPAPTPTPTAARASAPSRPTVDRDAVVARAQRPAADSAPSAPAQQPAAQPPAQAEGPGFLNIRSQTPMRVFVDGNDTGAMTPVSRQPIAPGRYRIELRDPSSGTSHAFSVQINSGQTRTLLYPPN